MIKALGYPGNPSLGHTDRSNEIILRLSLYTRRVTETPINRLIYCSTCVVMEMMYRWFRALWPLYTSDTGQMWMLSDPMRAAQYHDRHITEVYCVKFIWCYITDHKISGISYFCVPFKFSIITDVKLWEMLTGKRAGWIGVHRSVIS